MQPESFLNRPYPLVISVTLGVPDEVHQPEPPKLTEAFFLSLQPTENKNAFDIAEELDRLANREDGSRIPNRLSIEFEQYNWGAPNFIFEIMQHLGWAAGDAALGAAISGLLASLARQYRARVFRSLEEATQAATQRLIVKNPDESKDTLSITSAGDSMINNDAWELHFASSSTGRKYEVTVHRNGVMRFRTSFPL